MKKKEIVLKNDTVFTTGYIGRGIRPIYKTFPAGTRCLYTRIETLCGIYHTVSITSDGYVFEANKKEDNK